MKTLYLVRTFLPCIILFFGIELVAQPWTYDFGTGTGTFNTNNSNSTAFLNGISSTPSGGGTYRVRTSNGAGGSFVVANAGTSLGTGSELQINSPTSASTGKFGVYSWTSPSTTAYFKTKIRTTSSGNGSLTFALGTIAFPSDNNNLSASYNTLLTSVTITYASGSISSVVRRDNGSNTTISSSGFATDTNQEIEVYGNNSSGTVSYYRNGTEYSLATRTWDLWLDGTRIVTNGARAGTLAASTNLAGFGFFAESSASNAGYIYLDDLEYANALPRISIADNGTQVAAANVAESTNNHILNKIKIDAVTGLNPNLTGMTCTTAGGYDAADITNLKVRYSTDATLDGGDATLSTLSSPGAAGAKTFPSFSSQTITGGTSGYIFITADIAASSASSGNTISVNALTTSNLTFSTGIKESLATAGGTQTIVASASITTSTISPLEYCAGNNVSVAYSTSGSFSGTFTAQLSDDAGDFSAPTNIGTGASPITATIPTGTATGIGYRIRVVNNTPAVNGSDNGDDIEIYNSTTTVSPTTTQNISVSTNGTTLTVTEGSTPTSRKWLWSNTSGSGYVDFTPAETGTTYIPNFASPGSYYVVCETTYPSPCGVVTTISTEVRINVSANSITTGAVSGSPFCSGITGVNVPFTYSPAGSFPSGGSCTFTAQLSDETGDFSSATNLQSVVSNASGSQSISVTIPGATTAGSGYRIRVVSNSPSITGSDNGSNLSVTSSVTPSVSIAITTGSNPMCAGASVTFTATPTNGGGTPAYQWKVNGGDDGTNSPTFTSTSLAHNDVVTCVMTTSVTCPTSPTATSNGITMNVTSLVTPTVSIAVTTGSNPTCSGNSVTFTATPANLNGGSVAANAYQWKKGGVDIAGETASTYTSTTLANGEVITCAITVSGGCVTSSSATSSGITMVIYALPGNPTNPVAAVNPACTSTTLNTMTVPGGETYFWQGTTSNGAIDNLGDASSTYAVSSTGTYYVRAQNSNGCWSTGRGSVTVTVNTAITIGTSPTNQSVTSPATATFSVSGITGTIGGYQWEVSTDGGTNWNDVTTGTGGTTASYTTAATTTAMNNYQYRCIVLGTLPCADVTSSAATLTVAAGPCFSVDFETGNLSEWTSPGGTVNGATVNGGSGDYYLNLNVNGEWARLPTSNSYSSVSFNLKGSASSNSWTLYVQYSTDGGTNWNNISGAGTIAGSSIGTSYALQTVTIPTITSDVRLFLQRTSNSCYIGDLNAFCVTCTAPTIQATSITTNTPTTGGFSIGWTAGDGDGTMIVVRPTSSANTIPAIGTSYSPDLAWATAEQIDANNRVVFRNAGSTAGPVTGLTAETQYTITAYEYNTTDDCYNLTSPPSATRYTLSNEPGAHPATFTTSVCGNASLTLNFSAASTITNADGYIILRRQDGFNPTTTDVTDGIEPGSLSLPVGTTLVTTIANTATTSYVNTGLSAGTTYNYLIIPYNANVGAVAQTFNYRTSATPLTVSATTGNASSNSDIIVDPTFTYNSNILYTSYQGNPITNTTNSVGVLGLRIRDGGGASDGDAFSTTLTGITFTVNSVAQSSVRRYALFQGNTFVTEIANPGTSTVAFSGLSISAADNANTDFTLRVSFNNTAATITDNTQMTFSVASATTVSGCATVSSQFSAFSTVNSSTTSDRNRIEVVATQIVFGTQPASASANTNLNAFTIRFEDNNNILDFDSNRSITLTATDGGVDMSASPSYSITATHTGIITISNVQFTSAPQDDITITATTTILTTNVVESNPFDIFDIPIGSYRTIGSGTWLNTTGTSTWEELTSGGWSALGAGVTPTINGSPTFNVYIYHNVSLTAPSTNKNIFIENGGTLNTGTQSHTFRNVLVKNGGVFNKEAGNGTKFDASGVLEVLDGGAMWFSRTNSSAYATNLWAGTEKFHPNSNFVVLVTDEASGDGRLLTEVMDSISSFNGAKFGNFIINMSGNGNFPLFPAGINTKLTNGDFILRNATDNGMIFNNGSYTVTIGGDLIVESTYPQPFTLTNSASTVSFTVNDDVVHNGTAEFRLANSQTTNNPSVTLNIDSNLIIGSSNFNFDIGTSSTGTNKSIVNLKGDLTTGTGSILTGNTTTAKRGELNFMGTYDENDLSTIQTVDVASTGSNENAKVYFNVKDNSYTQLITRNFELGLNSKLTIEDGAIFDFGFNGTTPLYITTYSTGAQFESRQGLYLKLLLRMDLYEEWDRAAYTAAGVTVNTGNVQSYCKIKSIY
jgi:hypothetical protein